MTETEWFNKSNHQLAKRARMLIPMVRSFPTHSLLKRQLKEVVEKVRCEELVPKNSVEMICSSLRESQSGW